MAFGSNSIQFSICISKENQDKELHVNERKKGNSLLDKRNDFTVIDIETTGLCSSFDEIIEIAALKIRNNEIIDKFTSLCNPEIFIDSFIQELTGINNEMVKHAPKIHEVLGDFMSFVGNDVLIGHQVNFDINFIYDRYLNYFGKHFENDFIDTMRISRRVLPELEHHRLLDLVTYFSVDHHEAHRAMGDCEATYQCYLKLKDYIQQNNISLEKSKTHAKIDLRKIEAENPENIDITHPFYKKYCVFTGKLEKLTRPQAAQIVSNLGGINENVITKNTNFLILGNNDYCSTIKDGKSSKHKKAEEYILKGNDLQIIPEDVFLDMIKI